MTESESTPVKPFAGLRVADFSWVGVGPTVAKYLADNGAEVIRIESSTYPDNLRRAGPFVDDTPGIDNSGYFANFNSSKLGMTVNFKHPRGPELARRLVAECDIVTESFTPGTMARFGLDYAELSKGRDDLLMVSMPLFGSTGPWSSYMGFGHILQGAAGFNHLTGWEDGPPIGTGVAYTDFLVPHFASVALMAAIDYRRRTGKGQWIDFGQMEAAIHGLGTAILDWTANGHEQKRMGNHDFDACPHNAYRCADGRYVAVACHTEYHWERLKAALGRPEWCDMDRMRRKPQRLAEEREVDRHLAFWIEDYTYDPNKPLPPLPEDAPEGARITFLTTEELVALFQEFGVPCGIVQSPQATQEDPQMIHRGHYWKLQHPAMGLRTYDGPAFRLSMTPSELTKAAPLLGADNEYVYKELLGLSDDEFVELLADGALD